jgi:hypothetical protein
VPVNRQIVIKQKDASPFSKAFFFPEKAMVMEDVSNRIQADWKHQENMFNDFNSQYVFRIWNPPGDRK